MRIAAYQFSVSADILRNTETIKKAVTEAHNRHIDLLVFPECCLTGYPPLDIENSVKIDFKKVEEALTDLKKLCDDLKTAFIVGTAAREDGKIFNRAVFFRPGMEPGIYDKRALWGWDRENFQKGFRKGVFMYKGFRIGIRICFEVRFPEFFRELYKEGTELDAVLFYDVSDEENTDRYNMIKGHLATRAVENVCTVISSNSVSKSQTAPTAVFGSSGQTFSECPVNKEGFAEYEIEKKDYDFGELGRKTISDELLDMSS